MYFQVLVLIGKLLNNAIFGEICRNFVIFLEQYVC
ncbi:MAG: hypothetical protein H6Q67_881 [Firmicutes bacterium]|nr:hypothetical protein [Bacillota bacterium]